MANKIREMLENEYQDFTAALEGKFKVGSCRLELNRSEKVFVMDARDSIAYILSVLDGEVVLPSSEEDCETNWGQVFGYFKGSVLNLVMAEYLVYGQWTNIETVFSPVYEQSEQPRTVACYEDDDDESNDDCEERSIAERVAERVRGALAKKSASKKSESKKDKKSTKADAVAEEYEAVPVVVLDSNGKELTSNRLPKHDGTSKPRPMTGIPDTQKKQTASESKHKPHSKKSSRTVFFDDDED